MRGDESVRSAVRRTEPTSHTCALSLPDNDVFIRPALQPRGTGRTNPSIHDVIETSAGLSQAGTSCFPRSRGAAKEWWSQTGSNRRPHACKARALPTELWPLGSFVADPRPSARGVTQRSQSVVGPGRLELPTSRLSGVCSNHLSYRPQKRSARPETKPRPDTRSHRQPERLRCQRKEKRRRRRPAPVWCVFRSASRVREQLLEAHP
jgi:hypothetical protein